MTLLWTWIPGYCCTVMQWLIEGEKYWCFNNRPGRSMKHTWTTTGAVGFLPPWSLSPSLYHTRETEKVMDFWHRWNTSQWRRKEERKGDEEKRGVKNRVHSALHTGIHGAEGRCLSILFFFIKKNNPTKMNAKEHKVVMDLSDKGWQWDQEIVVSQDRPWKTFLLMLHKRWSDIITKH